MAQKVHGTFGPAMVDESKTARTVRGVFSGLGAGGGAGPSYDGVSAAVNVGSATVEGGVAGFLAGGVPGAIAGGLTGLVTSGLNAFLGIESENKRQAEMEKLIREIQEREDARDRRDRADQVSQLRYNRKEAELQKAWGLAQQYRENINELVQKSESVRDRFVAKGF